MDDICIIYHPLSARPTTITPFSNFAREHCPKPFAPDPNCDLWYQFHTLLDFEVTELALEASLSNEQTEHLIKLLHWVHDKCEKFTLRNHSDLRATWDAAGMWLTPVSNHLSSTFHYCQTTRLTSFIIELVPDVVHLCPVPEQAWAMWVSSMAPLTLGLGMWSLERSSCWPPLCFWCPAFVQVWWDLVCTFYWWSVYHRFILEPSSTLFILCQSLLYIDPMYLNCFIILLSYQ